MIIAAGIGAWYVIYLDRGELLAYDQIASLEANTAHHATIKVTLPGNTAPLFIPSREVFTAHGLWAYVAKNHRQPTGYQPRDLQPTSLPFSSTDSEPKISARIAPTLTRLFRDATADGHNLIISSAYRSTTAQQALYDDFVAKKGVSLANQYVAPAGSSEHHTGLAVDINDDTPLCRSTPEKCSLSGSSAAWLADHAPNYGFIIRYPAGGQPITGIAYEPWRLRYVGIVLAKQLSNADFTFDEFIAQVTPGATKNR